jgi:hypothetical protein
LEARRSRVLGSTAHRASTLLKLRNFPAGHPPRSEAPA